ncbi:MAG: undecaprenyl-diphosphate phosphatase [Gammaproteobacteria bacterium WSBS_2016_MAG_OTU1]
MESLIHWAHIVILGIVEGVTEFLPVSSTGHLIVVAHLFGKTEESDKLFEVVIQLGAVFAVCYEYRHRLWTMTRDWRSDSTRRMTINLMVAFLPAAICGLLFYDYIKAYLFSPQTVAVALIVGGIVIIIAERKPRESHINDVDDIRVKDALVIGLCQILALFPGVSRAGATIIGGVLWGVQRRAATEFSFLLALPVMFAASGYDLLRNYKLLNLEIIADIAVGFVVSFILRNLL